MKSKLITQEIIDKVAETYKKQWTIRKTHKALADLLTFHNVREIVNELGLNVEKQKTKLQELNDDIKSIPAYEVTEDHYIFYKSDTNEYWERERKAYPIAISTVDEIFKAYSKHWQNKTWEQILQEFKIKPELWNMLKNRLRLYKDSHVLSPVSLERFEWDEEWLQEFIDNAVDEHIQDKYVSKFQNSYERQFKEKAIKAMKRLANIDEFLEYVRDHIKDYKPREINFELPEVNINETIDFAITDLHIWKMWTDLVLQRLEKIYQDAVSRPEANINIFCLWDLAEILVQWWRHPWQIEWMDWPFWFDLFMKVVNSLENFLINIHKAGKNVKFIWITWNHWTLSDKKGWDTEFTWELLIYELLRRWLQNTNIEIEYLRGMWHSYPTENFHYILNHWYAGHTSKKAQDILREYWDNTRHNIILQWDKHHTNITDVSQNATRIITPCLAWKWEYDTQLWISSYPWYIRIEKNEDGLPDTVIKRLK